MKRIITILFFGCFVHFSLAQSVVKNVGSLNWVNPPSINIGDTIRYSYKITNTGTTNITLWDNGTPKVENNVNVSNSAEGFATWYNFVNDPAGEMLMEFRKNGDQITTLAAGDTIELTVKERSSAMYYKAGNSSLVIWPENVDGSQLVDSMKTNITVLYPTALSFEDDNKLEIYPNPSNGQNITLRTNYFNNRYYIYNSTGVLVQHGKINNELKVASLSVGLYTVKLIANNQVFTNQIVVNK